MSTSVRVALNLIAIICCTIAAVLNFMMGNIPLVIVMCGMVGMNSALLFIILTER